MKTEYRGTCQLLEDFVISFH